MEPNFHKAQAERNKKSKRLRGRSWTPTGPFSGGGLIPFAAAGVGPAVRRERIGVGKKKGLDGWEGTVFEDEWENSFATRFWLCFSGIGMFTGGAIWILTHGHWGHHQSPEDG